MPFPPALTVGLLQAAALPDTIVARMVPQRDLFDWTSGILQIIVLLLAVGMLIALILLALSVRAGVQKVSEQIERLTSQTRPLIERATGIVEDAREVVAMVRTDVERLSETTDEIRERVVDAVENTTHRIDEVNAVLDVLQTKLESTAIGTVSAIHGVRVGARALARGLAHPDAGGVDDLDDDLDDEIDGLDDLDDLDDMDDIELDDEATPA